MQLQFESRNNKKYKITKIYNNTTYAKKSKARY